MLLDDGDRCVEPGRHERHLDRLATHAVHRGVGNGDTWHVGAQPDLRHGRDVRLLPRQVEPLDQMVVLRGDRHVERVDRTDPVGDVGVDRGDDLRSRLEEHLVAVVGRRVVRRRDDHAGGRFEAGDRPGQDGRRREAGVQHRADAERCEHTARVEREHVALATRIARNDHAALGGSLDRTRCFLIEQPLPETSSRLTHDEPVHPHRPGSDGCSEPGGSELETPGETVGEIRQRVGVVGPSGIDERRQLAPDVAVGFRFEPRDCPLDQRCHIVDGVVGVVRLVTHRRIFTHRRAAYGVRPAGEARRD